tara:strand:+ start:1216 stop:2742 length:1527 start_codon:yes stop_codon:yes gene_type:complete
MDISHLNMDHFMPHGHCIMWDKSLLTLHVGSDFIIFLSYFSIPFAIFYYLKHKKNIPKSIVPYLFIAFILSCGVTHVFTIWNWWNADYWQSGVVKFICAAISSLTAVLLWVLMPKLLKVPTPAELEAVKQESELFQVESRNKSDILTSVTHEIRNHLNIMVGSSEILIRDTTNKENEKEIKTMMYNNALVLDRLLNDVLDLSKIETKQFGIVNEAFSLPHFIEELKSEYIKISKEKGINFKVDDKEVKTIENIKTDRTRLKQIMTNLISNAFKYTYNGEILITVKKEKFLSGSCELIFCVSDDGTGIPKEDQENIFETFTRSNIHSEIEGVGIGLSLSKRIAKLLGGDLELVESSKSGSTFKLNVPVTQVEKKAIKRNYKNKELPDLSGKKVLIADDSKENNRLMSLFLKDTNLNLDIVADGASAMEKILNNQYDLAILDIEMPKMSGIEIMKEIKKKDIDLPVIVVSARVSQDTIQGLDELGFVDCLSKPYKQSELLNSIENVLKAE